MRGVALAVLLGASACGQAEQALVSPDAALPSPDAAPGETDTVELAPFPGWPAEVGVRAVGHSFRTSVTKLESAPDSRVWLLRQEWRDQAPTLGTPTLERYQVSGPLEKRVVFADGVLVPDFVVHPSGELSVFLLEPDGGQGSYRLEIARLAADGRVLYQTPLADVPGPGENVFYDDTGVHVLPSDRPMRLSERSHVVGLADGEGVYLLAWTFGAKLYRLSREYTQRWNALVMPANLGMAFYFIHELLASDEDGRVYVAYQIFEDDVHIYNEHFKRAPLQAIGTYDVLVERFDPDGTFSGSQLYGGPGGDAPTGMTAHRGNVLVTGGSRVTKFDLPNRTREWDLFVLRGALDDPSTVSYRTLDLARDDFGWAMAEAADGTIYLAGRTDYVQVDTNSEVEDGKGLLVALSPDLTRRTTLTLSGPRDVQLQALGLVPDGRLIFAGMRNGPLTHTDPAMTFNEGVLGATRLARPIPLVQPSVPK